MWVSRSNQKIEANEQEAGDARLGKGAFLLPPAHLTITLLLLV
jgi:hypothetical protein